MNCNLSIFLIFSVFVASISAAKFISNGVSCSDKRLIINRHNEMRQKVASGNLPGQPKASNMQKIVWDDKLASLAQSWANKMKFVHNRNRKDGRFSVGENLYVSWSTNSNRTPDWSKALQEWYDEYELYTYGPLYSDPATGHYTQIVWADTMYVGCGFSLYKKNKMLHKLYVCNYGPAGNYLNQYPYKTGNGCENLCCKSQCGRLYGNQC